MKAISVILLSLLLTTPATAEVTVSKPAPKPPGPFFVHFNFAWNVYTYLGPTGDGIGANAENHIDPSKRGIIFQQIGFGYHFHKMLRVQLTLQFGETVTGENENVKTGFSLFGIIPWLVFSHKGFVAGVGPILAPVSYGVPGKFDAGIFAATGYSFKLPRNFSLGLLVQIVTWLNQRTAVAISPALLVGYRF
jgi:hypothetical protein